MSFPSSFLSQVLFLNNNICAKQNLWKFRFQAQFARRCAQFCAIVTTAPLVHIGILNVSTIPEGSFII